jgi:phosphotransferase system  glucose/maltose/N-acetylglucosamine-specific IIC component
MAAVNNAEEIKPVRILYVCQISMIDRLETISIENKHKIIVVIIKIVIAIILFFVIGRLSIILVLRTPKKANKTASRQNIIVREDKIISKS